MLPSVAASSYGLPLSYITFSRLRGSAPGDPNRALNVDGSLKRKTPDHFSPVFLGGRFCGLCDQFFLITDGQPFFHRVVVRRFRMQAFVVFAHGRLAHVPLDA